MKFLVASCIVVAMLFFTGVSLQDVFADHDKRCSISLSTYIYDSKWRSIERKSAEGQYYPGDGANVLAVWRATECLEFKILDTKTYGNVVVRSIQEREMPIGEIEFSNLTRSSSQDHFELWFSQYLSDKDTNYEPREYSTSTPHVWNIWAEDDNSRERFKHAVENRCNRSPPPPGYPPKIINYGCIFGHIELDTEYTDDKCYKKLNRHGEPELDSNGEEIIICEEFISKVVFGAEGVGKRCGHGEDRKCTEYTVTRNSEKKFEIRQPNLDLILNRDPFHDIYGFNVMNMDKTFYIDDVMGLLHAPNMIYVKNGPVQFVVEVKQDLNPVVVLNCIDKKQCPGEQNHPRTDERSYPQIYGHGKRGYHTLNVGDYSFKYTMSAYNIGTTLEYIPDTNKCDGNRDKLPKGCVIQLSRVDEERDCLGNKDRDCNWLEDRLLNVTSGTITIHAGPYEPVVKFYGHTIWNTTGIIPPDADTGVTATYFGSTENDVLYPERRMRIDDTYSIAIAYNNTHILRVNNDNMITTLHPYDPFIVLPKKIWLGFDSHEGNYTTIESRTMMESEGYGTIRFSTDGIPEVMLKNGYTTGITNATGYFMPYTELLGGNPRTYLNNTSYAYPEGHHAVSLNITVYDSDGMIKPSIINVTITPRSDEDRIFRDYIERKVGEEQDDDRITEIVGLYVAMNHTALSDTGQLISYIPRISHVYLSDPPINNTNQLDTVATTTTTTNTRPINNYATFSDPEESSNKPINNYATFSDPEESSNTDAGEFLEGLFSFVEQIPGTEQMSDLIDTISEFTLDPDGDASLPLRVGLYSAITPSNITVTADNVTRSWIILDNYYPRPINIIVNTEHDNDASWGKLLGLTTMIFEPTFGVVTSIYDGIDTKKVFCVDSCVVGSINYNRVLTANNTWGGSATSTYTFDRPAVTPVSDIEHKSTFTKYVLPINDILIITVIIIASLVIIWKLNGGKWPIYR